MGRAIMTTSHSALNTVSSKTLPKKNWRFWILPRHPSTSRLICFSLTVSPMASGTLWDTLIIDVTGNAVALSSAVDLFLFLVSSFCIFVSARTFTRWARSS